MPTPLPEEHAPTGSDIDSEPFLRATRQAKSRYGRFNLAIIGGTGVGKSSLVNAVFGRERARVGKGLPVTSGIHYYHDDSLGIWDVEGFEIGSARSPGETLRGHLAAIAERPAAEQISVVWYCVLSTADRLTQPDVDMIRALEEAGLPVILVLTKVAWTKHPLTGKYRAPRDVELFQEWLEHPTDGTGAPLHLPVHRVIPTSAHGPNGKGTGHGLGELVAETLALSPDSEKDAFRIAQRLNLPWKREMARPVIAAAAASAAAAAAIPLPIADAVTLAPIQMGMMARISVIYDLEFRSVLPASALAQLGAQVSGQALARSFVKLIPGVGSAVNATVAFSLTTVTGEGWLRLCEQIHTGRVPLAQVPTAWEQYSPTLVSVVKNLVEQRARRP